MQINLIIQSFIHLFKEMFIVYFIGGSEVGKEINVSVSLPWAVCGGEQKGERKMVFVF